MAERNGREIKSPGRLIQRRLKRTLDIILAACALVALTPALLLAAVAIRSTMGAPVLFRQVRPGRSGKPFELVKLRSMAEVTDASGRLAPDKSRVTRVGAILRRTSFDEVPELWNVLRGDMSVVGPRPLLTEFLEYYTPEQARRHDVKPGMTGWAQVHGRRSVQMQQRIALDVWYVEHWTLRLDARIILMTIGQVLRGASAEPVASVPIAELGWAAPSRDADQEQKPGVRSWQPSE